MCCLVHPLIFLNPQTLQTCEIQASVVIQLLALELGGEKREAAMAQTVPMPVISRGGYDGECQTRLRIFDFTCSFCFGEFFLCYLVSASLGA